MRITILKVIGYMILLVGLIVLIILKKEVSIPGIIIILGGFLNIFCVVSNGFKMPVKDLKKAKEMHKPLVKNTRFPYLADIFLVNINRNNYAFSIGDILLGLGLILNTTTIWLK